MLTAASTTPAEAQQAYRHRQPRARVGEPSDNGGSKVVNAIIVRGRDQVMLKVTVAEVQRDVIKQLGIDLTGSFNMRHGGRQFHTSNPFSAIGQSLSARHHGVRGTLSATSPRP